MNTFTRRDWFFAALLLAGLVGLVAFEWSPALILFLIGAAGFVGRDTRWQSS